MALAFGFREKARDNMLEKPVFADKSVTDLAAKYLELRGLPNLGNMKPLLDQVSNYIEGDLLLSLVTEKER
jgi:hypothetical protein